VFPLCQTIKLRERLLDDRAGEGRRGEVSTASRNRTGLSRSGISKEVRTWSPQQLEMGFLKSLASGMSNREFGQ
jgi:hypothetical protein